MLNYLEYQQTQTLKDKAVSEYLNSTAAKYVTANQDITETSGLSDLSWGSRTLDNTDHSYVCVIHFFEKPCLE